MSFLVDTNILSELAKKIPNAGVQEWARGISKIFISMVTLEEIYFGLNWKPQPKVTAWFEKFLEEHCNILSVSELIAKRSGELRGQLRAAER